MPQVHLHPEISADVFCRNFSFRLLQQCEPDLPAGLTAQELSATPRRGKGQRTLCLTDQRKMEKLRNTHSHTRLFYISTKEFKWDQWEQKAEGYQSPSVCFPCVFTCRDLKDQQHSRRIKNFTLLLLLRNVAL